MEDVVELGIEGVDKVVDNHFHRIPDKYMHKDPYIPHRSSKKKQRQRRRTRDSEESEEIEDIRSRKSGRTEDFVKMQRDNTDGARGGGDTYLNYDNNGLPNYASPKYSYTDPPHPIYSDAPPHQRPQYTPYIPPQDPPRQFTTYRDSVDDRRPRSAYGGRRRRESSWSGSDSSYDSDHDRRPVRPKNLQRRRSSSYHGPSSRRADDMALAKRSGSDHMGMEKVKDKADRYQVKNEIEGLFTTSHKGLAGSAVGALVGGWAAHKAQEAAGRDHRKGDGLTNGFLTLLGAAAGGLAVNVGVEKWEEANANTDIKQDKWDKKWGRDEGRSRSRSLSRSHRGSRRGSRDRKSGRGKGRTDDYSSEDDYYRR